MPVSMTVPLKVRRSTMAAQRRGSVKVLAQPAEGLVGGDGDAVLLLAFGEDLEEEFGASAVEFHVAELIGAEQVDAAVAGDLLFGCFSSAASTSLFSSLVASV